MDVDKTAIKGFRQTVWQFYRQHGRHGLPWRLPEPDGSFDAYKILVSEVMLQQTQVTRVIPKYQTFLAQFPDARSLAQAPLGEVLAAWSGLGYNRRAKYLWQTAQQMVANYDGSIPNSITELVKFPGIGHNTAAAVLAYAFNEPVAFVETNIRTVFIHHFFAGRTDIPDTEILQLVVQTLAEEKEQPELRIHSAPGAMRKTGAPGKTSVLLGQSTVGLSHYRIWYWALMDYGSYLKQNVGNANKRSRAYAKQPAFPGSLRQLRGKVLRLLVSKPRSKKQLLAEISDDRLPKVLKALVAEGLVQHSSGKYYL